MENPGREAGACANRVPARASRRAFTGSLAIPYQGDLGPHFRDLMPGIGWVWLGKGWSCDCTLKKTVKTPCRHCKHQSPSLPPSFRRRGPREAGSRGTQAPGQEPRVEGLQGARPWAQPWTDGEPNTSEGSCVQGGPGSFCQSQLDASLGSVRSTKYQRQVRIWTRWHTFICS